LNRMHVIQSIFFIQYSIFSISKSFFLNIYQTVLKKEGIPRVSENAIPSLTY
jgi:hypothetical protein